MDWGSTQETPNLNQHSLCHRSRFGHIISDGSICCKRKVLTCNEHSYIQPACDVTMIYYLSLFEHQWSVWSHQCCERTHFYIFKNVSLANYYLLIVLLISMDLKQQMYLQDSETSDHEIHSSHVITIINTTVICIKYCNKAVIKFFSCLCIYRLSTLCDQNSLVLYSSNIYLQHKYCWSITAKQDTVMCYCQCCTENGWPPKYFFVD